MRISSMVVVRAVVALVLSIALWVFIRASA